MLRPVCTALCALRALLPPQVQTAARIKKLLERRARLTTAELAMHTRCIPCLYLYRTFACVPVRDYSPAGRCACCRRGTLCICVRYGSACHIMCVCKMRLMQKKQGAAVGRCGAPCKTWAMRETAWPTQFRHSSWLWQGHGCQGGRAASGRGPDAHLAVRGHGRLLRCLRGAGQPRAGAPATATSPSPISVCYQA